MQQPHTPQSGDSTPQFSTVPKYTIHTLLPSTPRSLSKSRLSSPTTSIPSTPRLVDAAHNSILPWRKHALERIFPLLDTDNDGLVDVGLLARMARPEIGILGVSTRWSKEQCSRCVALIHSNSPWIQTQPLHVERESIAVFFICTGPVQVGWSAWSR